MEIILGAKYRDKITGFEGVAMGYVEYLSGCNQVLIIPSSGSVSDKYPESQWLDAQRMMRVKPFKAIVLENDNTPGFDKAAPRK